MNSNVNINSGGHANPLIYLNGSIFEKGLHVINPDTVGAMFAVGDSSYLRRTYGTNHRDTSLIYHYFGKQRNRGILFIFTKDKVEIITQKQLKKIIADKRNKCLFKINNEPLTISYHKVDSGRIKMIKYFTLKNRNRDITDTFTLFIIT